MEYIEDYANGIYNEQLTQIKTLIPMKQSKLAFKVLAFIPNQSWNTRSSVFTAKNMEEAKIKAIKTLNLSNEHIIEIEKVNVYGTGSKLQTDNYPYGRLKATAFFSVESNKKGMRTVFQTINPKNNRLNKPKLGNYYQVILPMQLDNGHYDYCGFLDFNGTESINRGLQFMADFYELFTNEQVKEIAVTIIAMSKINVKAMCAFGGSNFNDIEPLIKKSIETLVIIVNEGKNLFTDCLLDIEAMEKTKNPNFQPFSIN